MRDPAVRIDLEIQAAIEETRRFLEPYVRRDNWQADNVIDLDALARHFAIQYIERSSAPEWVKPYAREQLKVTKKRGGKPTRHSRNFRIVQAAGRLVSRGYLRTRSDATRDKESSSSIIREALRLLGVKMKEKAINDILLQYSPDSLC